MQQLTKANKIFLALAITMITICSSGQQTTHQQSSSYEWPTEPDVKGKLEKWQDQKFGIILHWGLYAVPGIIESWNLCSEDWIERDSNTSYEDYKKWYWGQMKNFNPVNFDPESWAKISFVRGLRHKEFSEYKNDHARPRLLICHVVVAPPLLSLPTI